jgi:Flp pilus assembly protein TadD
MARAEWNTRTVDGIRRSVALARQAIERDPEHAVAYGMLALAHVVLASYTPEPADGPMELARQAAHRALELDERTADAHTALGLICLSYDWRWADAERAFRRATDLAPDDATAWSWFGFWHLSRGDGEQALLDTRRAERLNPASLIIKSQVAWVLYFMRRYAEALDQLEKTLEREPHFWRAYLNAAWCYMAAGQNEDAVHALETAVALNDYPLLRSVLARGYARAGRQPDARRLLAEIASSDRYAAAYYLAQVWSALGDDDEAGRSLEKSCDAREWHLIFLRADPGMDDLRGHAAYARVVTRVGF